MLPYCAKEKERLGAVDPPRDPLKGLERFDGLFEATRIMVTARSSDAVLAPLTTSSTLFEAEQAT